MKKLSFQSRALFFSTVVFGIFLLAGNTVLAQKVANKNTWTFTNSTGETANDLHLVLQRGCNPTNLTVDATGVRRAGGVWTNFPTQGSPTNHDYSGGEVENGGNMTLQFDAATKPLRWWWTKDGNRIGNEERTNSPDLVSLPLQPNIPDYLVYKVKGTGQTTGHIADLTVYNPTKNPAELTIPSCYIPSDGKYQSYVVAVETNSLVGPYQQITLPLSGNCANVYNPAVPEGTEMPAIDNWVFGDADYLSSIPQDLISNTNSAADALNGTVVTLPGTDLPITIIIDQAKNPELFGQIAIAALENITAGYEVLSTELQTPYSSQPDKQREAVIQHTFWLFTSTLSGNPYKVENLKENVIKQYEAGSGEKYKHATPEVKEEIDKGVQNLWNSFEMVGEKAKVLKGADEIKSKDDLPQLIKPGYNKYEAARALGKNHKDAMKDAFVSEDAREKWGDTFKKIYGK